MNTTEQKVVELYKSGATIREVIRQMGCSYGYVYRVLDENGVPRRTSGYGAYGEVMARLDLKDLVEIVEDYRDNHISMEGLTYKYNLVNNGVARNIIHRGQHYLKEYYSKEKQVDVSLDNVEYD